jgi:hypothetical protein
MIKIRSIFTTGVLLASLLFAVPNLSDCFREYRELVNVKQNTVRIKEQLSSLDQQLLGYKEKYKDLKIQSNLDIAEMVCSLDGVKFLSVASIAEIDGDTVNCSEVTKPKDVMFFSNQTKQMKFRLIFSDLKKFLKALNSSALPVNSMTIDTSDKLIYLVTDTIFESTYVKEPAKAE